MYNTGEANLNLGTIEVPAGYKVIGAPTSVAPGESATFTLRMATKTAGKKAGAVSFTNNDFDENPFNFKVTGSVTATLSLLSLTQPVGPELRLSPLSLDVGVVSASATPVPEPGAAAVVALGAVLALRRRR